LIFCIENIGRNDVSLDGFIAGPDDTRDQPAGEGSGQLLTGNGLILLATIAA